MADMPGAATMMPPGAGTPGGSQPPPVAAGSQEDSTAQEGSGVLPPNAGSVPQPVQALGKQAQAFDLIHGAINLLNMAVPHILDRDANNALHEAILKIQKIVPTPESKDSSIEIMQKILQAKQAASGRGQGAAGPPPPPGGPPPGMPQV